MEGYKIMRYLNVKLLSILLFGSSNVNAVETLPAANFSEKQSEQEKRVVLEQCVFGSICNLPVVNQVQTDQPLANRMAVRSTYGLLLDAHNGGKTDFTSNYGFSLDSDKLLIADELTVQVTVPASILYAQDCHEIKSIFVQRKAGGLNINRTFCQGDVSKGIAPTISGRNWVATGGGTYPIETFQYAANGAVWSRGIFQREINFINPRFVNKIYEGQLKIDIPNPKQYIGGTVSRLVDWRTPEVSPFVEYDVQERILVHDLPWVEGTTNSGHSLSAAEWVTGPRAHAPVRALAKRTTEINIGCSNFAITADFKANNSLENEYTAEISLAKRILGTHFVANDQLSLLREACANNNGSGGYKVSLNGANLFLPNGSTDTTVASVYIRYGQLKDEIDLWDEYGTSIRDDLNYRFGIWDSLNNVNNTFATSNTELLGYMKRAADDMRLVLTAYAINPANSPVFTLAEVDQFFYGPDMGELAGFYIPAIDSTAVPASWTNFDSFAKAEAEKGDPISPYVNYISENKLLRALNDVRISGSAAVLVNIVNTALVDLSNEMSRANYFLTLIAAANTSIQTALGVLESEITGTLVQVNGEPLTPLTIASLATAPVTSPVATYPDNSFLPITSVNGPNAPITASSYIDVYWTGAAPPSGYNIAIFDDVSGALRMQKTVRGMTQDASGQWHISLLVSNTMQTGDYHVAFTSIMLDPAFGSPRSDIFTVVR